MFKEQLFMALDSLRANKFRSLLTMLGIIIGAATLVAVLSLGNALQGQVFERFIDLGTRRVAVLPGDPKAKGARDVPGYGLLSVQDYATLERLAARHPEVFRTIAPEIALPQTIRFGTTAVEASVVGTGEQYKSIQTVPMKYGRFLTAEDERQSARVGVLGNLVAKGLFGEDLAAQQAAIGRTVEINGQPLQIVGIIDDNGGPFSTDNRVFAPVSTVRLRLIGDLDLPGRGTQMTSILLGLQSERDVGRAEELIKAALRDGRGVPAEAIDDFDLNLPTQALNVLSGINGAITGFIALVAGISLAGGLIGVSFAIGLVLLAGAAAGFAAPISWAAVALALAFASAIGIGFGFYPARRAALLPPIEALRYE